jgi:hypothetical protein
VLVGNSCPAQDTHYWAQPFGTRSALLGGAVVGGVDDNTSVYYNPGSLGFIDTGSISVSGNLYRIESFRIQNALGNKVDFKSKDLGSVPLLVAGTIRTKSARWRIGYGILQPVDFDFKASGRLDGFFPVADDATSPGNEELICQRNVTSSLHEIMVALTPALRLGEHWSVGLGNFFTGRSQTYNSALLARVYLNDAGHTLVTADEFQHFNYFHLRYVAKLGIAWQGRQLSAGLTVSTPGLRLVGKGAVGADYTGTNIVFNGTRQDIVADGIQPKLKTVYHSPFNVSGGLNWKFGRNMLAVAGQYFGKEGVYDILRTENVPFVRPTGAYPDLGASSFLRVQTAARTVFNGVLGYERQLSKSVTLQCSFRNDMSYYDKDLDHAMGIRPDITTWNIYTAAMGVAIGSGRSQVTVGLTGSRGSDNHHAESGNYTQPENDPLLRGAVTITKASYSSIGLLIGFKYRFKKI